jgi:hypothetical protein
METGKSPAENKQPEKPSATGNLLKELNSASEGLFYRSETDAPFEAFDSKQEAQEASAQNVLQLAGQKTETKVTEKTLDEFFEQPTQLQDWHGDEEKAQVEKFIRLKELISKNLRDVKVFKIGEVEVDIYIVGINADGKLAGVKTKAVET